MVKVNGRGCWGAAWGQMERMSLTYLPHFIGIKPATVGGGEEVQLLYVIHIQGYMLHSANVFVPHYVLLFLLISINSLQTYRFFFCSNFYKALENY